MRTATSFNGVRQEVVALFDDEDALNDVVDELHCDGFERAEISVSQPWNMVEKQIGRGLASTVELSQVRGAPHAAPLDRGSFGVAQGACIAGPLYLFACGAIMASAASGAALATIMFAATSAGLMGVALGMLSVLWLRRAHRSYIDGLLDRGGLILWVHIADRNKEQKVRAIFSRHAARDVRCTAVAA